MAMPTTYKPSPLGPRSSPFRRPESPVSPSPLRHAPSSPFKTPGTPSHAPTAPTLPDPSAASSASSASSAHTTPTPAARFGGRLQPAPDMVSSSSSSGNAFGGASALSQLQPAQVRTLREGFQILDRDSDGHVARDDVADMLNQLGLPAGPADIGLFFPPGAPQTLSLGAFLQSLAVALAALSPSAELLSALAAFDEDDSGEIDPAELRDALLHTAPEPGTPALSDAAISRVMAGFLGRRAFTKSSGHKAAFGGGSGAREVFKYQELVHSIAGSGTPGGDDEEE